MFNDTSPLFCYLSPLGLLSFIVRFYMRKTLFKIHSWLAVVFFIPILVISLTGSLLIFKVEIDSLLIEETNLTVSLSIPRKNIDILKDKINRQFSNYEIGSWEMFDDHYRADAVYMMKRGTQDWYKIYLDPYSGNILSSPSAMGSDLTDWLTDLHYTLLLADKGIFIVFVLGLILLFLGISGLIIYRKFYLKLFTLRLKSAALIICIDIHKMIGALISPVLLVVGITGVYWNAKEFIHEVSHTQEQEEWVLTNRLYSDNIHLETILSNSQEIVPSFLPTYLLMPFDATSHITVYGYVDSPNPLYSNYNSWLVFDKNTGQFKSKDDIREGNILRKFDDSIRRLHFGSFSGLAVKIIWSIVGFCPLILCLTGGYMWLKRKKKYKK